MQNLLRKETQGENVQSFIPSVDVDRVAISGAQIKQEPQHSIYPQALLLPSQCMNIPPNMPEAVTLPEGVRVRKNEKNKIL